jgi:hypothetical protein
MLSFITFYMSPDTGERLGFGITMILAMLALDITASEMMPVCNEKTFMDYLSQVTFLSLKLTFLSTQLTFLSTQLTFLRTIPGLPTSPRFACSSAACLWWRPGL